MDQEVFINQVAMPVLDLSTRLERIYSYRSGMSLDTNTSRHLLNQVVRFAADLESPDRREEAAYTLMAVLYPATDPPWDFWRTEAGRAVAQAIGYHRMVVPCAAAAAILGVSRQRVGQLCQAGRLVRVGETTAVTALSLREQLRTGPLHWRVRRRQGES